MVATVPLRRGMPEVSLDEHWDALIAGGGPAGAAAACQLAGAGRKVLLIEKERRAHHKVCGEFISFEARTCLLELGLDPARLGAAPIRIVRLFKGRRVLRTGLPFSAAGLSRFVLDEHLLACARRSGATILRGERVKTVKPAGGIWRAQGTMPAPISADAIFLATGKHDLRDLKREPGRQNDLIGFKMHFRLTERQRRALYGHIDIVALDGGYAGLQPIEGRRANLCLLIRKDHFLALDKCWENLLGYLARRSPHLGAFLDRAIPCWPRPAAIASLPYGFLYDAEHELQAGLYRLGDQFAVIPSFSGDGLSIALHTARLAAGNYLRDGKASRAYHRQARIDIRPPLRMASKLARAIERPLTRELLFTGCRLCPPLVTSLARNTRIASFQV